MLKKDAQYRGSQLVCFALMIAFGVVSVWLCFYTYGGKRMFFSRALMFPLFYLIPPVFRAVKLQHCWRLYSMLYAFSLFAFSYGCVYGAFSTGDLVIDKVSHFFSGTVFTIVGLCLYYWQAGKKPGGVGKGWFLAGSYAVFFSAFVAVMWEVAEFIGFVWWGNDSQNHLTTGVFDTMGDLIACMIASVISLAAFALYRYKRVRLLSGAVVEEFCDKL